MTCIVGIVSAGDVWIGADSETSSGWSRFQDGVPKVYRLLDFLIAQSGPVRLSNILRYQFLPPDDTANDQLGYMVGLFVPALRKLYRENGALKVEDSLESVDSGKIMVGYRGQLFEIDTDFSVVSHARGYNAIGIGEEYALGALFATEDLPPQARIHLALSASMKHSMGVYEPFVIECLEKRKRSEPSA